MQRAGLEAIAALAAAPAGQDQLGPVGACGAVASAMLGHAARLDVQRARARARARSSSRRARARRPARRRAAGARRHAENAWHLETAGAVPALVRAMDRTRGAARGSDALALRGEARARCARSATTSRDAMLRGRKAD